MTRIPSDVSAVELCKRLAKLGYVLHKQSGSHMTYTTQLKGEHHAYIPRHNPIKVGTLRQILNGVAEHQGLTTEELVRLLGI